ncbi:MAG: HlyD family secretion protein [Solirubrobacteraceae bacterium]|nr:HlyD family secretion protein [Solirubrobacteraceae bacterium]
MKPITRVRVLSALIGGFAIVAVVIWASGRGNPAPTATGEVVRAERGEVATTVGGIGHVSTLTEAALQAVPASGGAGGGSAGSGTSAGGSGGSGGGGSPASADAVFPAVAGHVARVLVKPGEHVVAGQPVAVIADDGVVAGNVLQARSDLSTARLELAQRRVQDPARGVPPTAAELASGRESVLAARAKLGRVVAPPLAADVAAAQVDYKKAVADLSSARTGAPQAIAAAQLAVTTARQRLETVSGAPDRVDLTAAQLELARATLEQEALLRPADAPSASAIQAADLAISAARQKLADAEAAGNATDTALARAELAKAQSERDALTSAPAAPTAAARAAAQLAIDAARSKLDAIVRPPAATVTAARQQLAGAESDLSSLTVTRGATGVGVARAAVTAARRKLARLRHPTSDILAAARSDVRKARADLAVLRQRGAPASATDLALARLKVNVSRQRLALAQDQIRRLTVAANASGTVTSVLTARGAAADPTTPLVRVEDLDHLVIALDLSEFDVGRIRVGSPVRIGVDALGGKQFGGHVRDIASAGAASGGVVNFPVIVSLNSHRRLRPGMSVSARVVVTRRRDVVRIPLAAVAREGGGPSVMVRTRSGALRRRAIVLGLSGAEFAEVRSGLRAGERVVLPAGGA